MKIETTWISKTRGIVKSGYYEDCEDFSTLPPEKIQAICAFCYYDGKFVIVKNETYWEPISGHMEEGESPEETLIREVKEESNMKVLKYFPLGYLYVNDGDFFQVQYLCLVEPYGPFVSGPDGGVTENMMIYLEEMPEYLSKNDTSNLTLSRCKTVLEKVKIDNKL